MSEVSTRDEKGLYGDGISVVSKNGSVRVDWVNLGEGDDGDYDPSDSSDNNLLRFDVYFKDPVSKKWVDPGDASYCTLMPAKINDDILVRAAKHIAETLEDHTVDHTHTRICENLSWTSPEDFSVTEEVPANGVKRLTLKETIMDWWNDIRL